MRKYSISMVLWYIVIISVLSCGNLDDADQPEVIQDAMVVDTFQNNDDTKENLSLASRPLFDANSLDLALVSDSFFTQLFSNNTSAGAPLFYQHAFRNGDTAELFIPLESLSGNVITNTIDTAPFQTQYSPLTNRDLQRIILSNRVIATPLLSLLAPMHVQIIKEQRDAISKSDIQFFSYDQKIHHPKYVTVDFSYALEELGKIAADLAIRQQSDIPTLVVLLDSLQRESMLHNMKIIMRSFYQYVPYGTVILHWDERVEQGEELTRQQIYDERYSKSVLLLNAGMHTLSGIVYIKDLYEKNQNLWNDRVLIMNYWENRSYEHTGFYFASVGAPLDIFFKDKYHVSAQIRRTE